MKLLLVLLFACGQSQSRYETVYYEKDMRVSFN